VIDPAAALVLRVALAWLLVAGGVAKLRDRAGFRAAVEGYEVLPVRAVAPAAIAFALAEFGLGIALFAAPHPAVVLGVAALFGLYGVAIAWNLARGRREIDCGCGGGAHVPLSGWLLARNALLVGAALACATETTDRALGWIDAITVAAGVAALALLWTAAHGLLAWAGALARMQEDV
jgi:uncharacterized membrane protein YphA (DoxX/SURF4 family)